MLLVNYCNILIIKTTLFLMVLLGKDVLPLCKQSCRSSPLAAGHLWNDSKEPDGQFHARQKRKSKG